MLEIKNLYVEGKGHAQLLRGVSFSMKLGECIGLTGPSGAGKTTIIKAIMAFWTTPAAFLPETSCLMEFRFRRCLQRSGGIFAEPRWASSLKIP